MASRKKLPRLMWQRKPQTQVVPNRRALERKMACRKKIKDCCWDGSPY